MPPFLRAGTLGSECHTPGCSLLSLRKLEVPGKKTFSWGNDSPADFLEPMLSGIFLIKRLKDAAHCGWDHLWEGGPGCTKKQTEQVNKQHSCPDFPQSWDVT